jgi:hypothetical protein
MKKVLLLSVISGLMLVSFSSCEDLLNQIGVTINSDYTYVDFNVNPDKAGTFFETVDVEESNLDSIIEAEGQNIGELNSVKIKDAGIQVTDNGNLDAFESFKITIEAAGKDPVTVAEVTTVPDGISEIALTKEAVDLSEYLKSDQYTIKVKTVLDQDLETQRSMRAKVRFEIKVGL